MGSFHDDLLKKVARYCSRYFRDKLSDKPDRISKLKESGVNETVIDRFDVGYASEEWTSLTDRLRDDDRGYILDCARTLGIVVRGKRGLHDRFRNRYVLPISSDEGSVVGFTSFLEQSLNRHFRTRAFDLVQLNSSHSPIFNKRDYLLGANQALDAVAERDQLLVAEDPQDTLIFHSKNRCNVVSELISGALSSAPEDTQTGHLRDRARRIYRIESRQSEEKHG